LVAKLGIKLGTEWIKDVFDPDKCVRKTFRCLSRETMALTDKQKIGNKGENIAVRYLEGKGYKIIDRNYRKKWGEIDIVAIEGKILHFVEVKTVSRETNDNVAQETNYSEDFLPEDNVHYLKRKRLSRAIETYLLEKKVSQETPFQIDIISIYVSRETGAYEVDFLDDIVL
jgi:putative endonuclease